MGSVAVPALLDIWQTGSREAKLQVAGPLGESGDPAAIEPLAARLDDPDLQFEAAYALGRLGDACGMGILLDSLRGYYDDDDHDPSCSLVALGSQAVAPLIEIAENIESPVRAQAVTLLGEIGDSAAIDALTRLRDDPALNKEALIALGKCGDERVMPELLELARNADSDWDIDVASALGRIGQAAVGSLGDLAAGGSNRTKELVASALGDIPCDESVGILDRLLNDPDADVREWAADSLWELARENLERFGQTSIQILERYLEDPYPEVRGKAAQWSADLRADLGLPENPDATKLLWRNM
jgi:HEAT repeat protein